MPMDDEAVGNIPIDLDIDLDDDNLIELVAQDGIETKEPLDKADLGNMVNYETQDNMNSPVDEGSYEEYA